jgi:RNA polymerase-binding transcription factor
MNTNVTSINAGIKRRQAVLESKLSELLKVSAVREDLEIQLMADPLDQVQSNTDRDMAVETLNQQARSIRDIRSALVRIEEGSYGQCERCEEPIPPKRLEALPWARMCVTCQSAIESKGRQSRTVFDNAA